MKNLILLFLGLLLATIGQAQIAKTVNLTTAGTLSTVLTSDEKSTVTNLTITGPIDARDFTTMRDSMNSLRVVDLMATTVIEYTGALGTNGTVSITYPANTIPENGFYNHTALTTITLPSTLTAIGRKAFISLYKLRTVIIPSSVTVIGNQAFRGCEVLESIDLPDELETLDDWAFYDCTSLLAIDIPSKVTTLREMTFKGCSAMKTVKLPQLLTTIGYGVFQGCSSLATINLDSAITSIGTMAFSGTALKDVVLPSSLEIIGESAFKWCFSLTSVSIPASVTSIGNYAFTYSPGSIHIDAENPNYSSIDGVLFDKSQSTLIHCPVSMSGSYTIPKTVTTIDLSAFEQCRDLTAITLPSSLITIKNFAFKDCSKLTTISIPSSVKYIGSSAFYFCKALTSFYANPVTPVDLTIQTSVFGDVNTNTCILHVPFGSLSAYLKANQWKDFTHITEMPGFTLSDFTANVEAASGSSDSVTIKSNTTWTAIPDQLWLKVSPETGTTDGTIVFTAEANTSTKMRTATVIVSATGAESQSIIIKQAEGNSVVPVERTLSSVNLGNGTIECFNATDNIVVAGDDYPVVFENNSTATLIAGKSIRFLPGFHAQPGSWMDAHITTTNSFCNGQSASIAEQSHEKSISEEEIQPNQQKCIAVKNQIKIFPNPNNGSFTVQSSSEDESKLIVISLTGQRVFGPADFTENVQVQIDHLSKGIYLCHIKNKQGVQVRKIEVK